MHGIVYVSENDAPQDPLEVEVRKMSELLAQVKDEQSYIVVRERTHRNTAESTNSRVKWWNLFIVGIVIGESVFQVWWLRRFFEVCPFPVRDVSILQELTPKCCRSSGLSSHLTRHLFLIVLVFQYPSSGASSA